MIRDLLTGEERLGPGVRGYTLEFGRGLYVPWIAAEREGQGDVGRYLDALPCNQRVVFPNVISPRLAGMLLRRGFHVEDEWAAEFNEYVECFVREAMP